ncbi:MAG TPA: MFS transporter, partial [Pseudomonadales bacterium]
MPPTSIKAFTVLLIAQSFSIFGTSLTGFALGVWVYNEVGSATIYSLIALANGIPIVLFSPLAGAIVDRVNRKKIILAAQLAACLITATLMLLYSVDAL